MENQTIIPSKTYITINHSSRFASREHHRMEQLDIENLVHGQSQNSSTFTDKSTVFLQGAHLENLANALKFLYFLRNFTLLHNEPQLACGQRTGSKTCLDAHNNIPDTSIIKESQNGLRTYIETFRLRRIVTRMLANGTIRQLCGHHTMLTYALHLRKFSFNAMSSKQIFGIFTTIYYMMESSVSD